MLELFGVTTIKCVMMAILSLEMDVMNGVS